MKLIRLYLLFPISFIYWLFTHLRNIAYDSGLFKSHQFSNKIICVGNLCMGGAGKTPVVEYITELLSGHKISVAILSRGYKRKTKGYISASISSSSLEIGDEPYQLKQKFPDIQVAVCEKRVVGINKILQSDKLPDVIILDDAFQHRSVKAGLNILLTEYNKPFFNDCILPSGNLRESKRGMKRAEIIIVTKSPDDLSDGNMSDFQKKINPLKMQSLFFAGIKYEKLKAVYTSAVLNETSISDYSVLLFTGIANPFPLIKYLQSEVKELFSMKFADHYSYTLKDAEKVGKKFSRILNPKKIIVTTEKDIARIDKTTIKEHFKELPLYYIPIKVNIFKQDDNNEFDFKILNYVKQNTGNL